MRIDIQLFLGDPGVEDLLSRVDAVVSGEEVGDRDSHQKVGGGLEAEHLAAYEERRDGAVCHAAEDAGHADGGEEAGIHAEKAGSCISEDRTDKEGGDNFTSLEASGEGERGEEDLKEKGVGSGAESLVYDSGNDGMHAGSVVALVSDGEGQRKDGDARDEASEIGVFQVFVQQGLDPVHTHTEEYTHQSAEKGKENREKGAVSAEIRHLVYEHGAFFCSEKFRDQMGGQGGDHTGDEGKVVDIPHGTDLHREHGGREGSAEEGGEGGAHAAHYELPSVVIPEMKDPSEEISERASHLESRTLPTDGGAEEVGEDGGEDDERGHLSGDAVSRPDRLQDEIGPLGLPDAEEAVVEYDGDAGEGKEEDQPGMGETESGDEDDRIREFRGDRSDEDPA